AQSGDFPHLLVYGPSGAGKKTRIIATLKELFGPGVERIKIDARVFQTTSNRKLEFNVVTSVYHLEITPSDVGTYDRVVVQELLKEVAQTQQVDVAAKQRFKVVVINEADHLTRDAQAALRRTMEKYSPNLRLILLANSTANIISPIRSRTLLVRVPAPTEAEIAEVLDEAVRGEGWDVRKGLNIRIAKESGRNLRKALLMVEAIYAQHQSVTDKTPIPPPDWEALITIIADEVIEERSPQRIMHVRARLYDLLTHCIPPTTIIRTLAFKLIERVDDPLKPKIIKWAAFYEHRIRLGTKVIFHLEAFVAKFMRIYEGPLYRCASVQDKAALIMLMETRVAGCAGKAALRSKNKEAQKAAVEQYFKHWDNKSAKDETEEERKVMRPQAGVATMFPCTPLTHLRHRYYNLATDFYEYGWGSSFHFCRFAPNEPFRQAIARHEHYLAHMMSLSEEQLVLDVGCGVGGPAREIVKFTGVNVVGINNNDYQIERATHYAKKDGLADKLRFTKGDFMQMPFADATFDAVYAIEATCHAPALEDIYREIYRVLKPGGTFGVYEWVMTDKYDPNNEEHRAVRLGIEQGDGISNMDTQAEALRSIKAAGFDLIVSEDLALRPDAIPWYYPIAGQLKYASSLWDLLSVLRMTRLGRSTLNYALGVCERLGLFPAGSKKTGESLAYAADCLVKGGQMGLFTPMYLMVGKKPLDAAAATTEAAASAGEQ
ncbi:Replication factor C (RF-C) subunit, partial [Ascosphaera acerosa]